MATPKRVKGHAHSAANTKAKKAAGKLVNTTIKKRIPPPPGPDASMSEQADYQEKYSFAEQEEAGYLQDVPDKKFLANLAKSARAQRLREQREQVNISLEPLQFSKLQRLAKRKHLSPSTLARCWLLERLTEEGA